MIGDSDQRGVLIGRCAVGAAQGLALYLLTRFEMKLGGDAVLGAAMFVSLLWPAILLVSIGAMSRVHLGIWGAASGLLIGALGAYAAWRLDTDGNDAWLGFAGLVVILLFVAHHLVQSGLKAGKWRAPYSDYFDLSWTHAVRLALSLAFVGAFWALLWLGAALFDLIGVTMFAEIITEPAFAWPASTIAFALATHLTAERASLVIGARTLKLALLSWLLPLAAGITLVFLAVLPFAGLDQLWDAKIAAGLMLSTGVALVLLINAAFQAGESPLNPALRIAARAGSVLLLPLVAIAAYGLFVRTSQYGLTESRVIAWAGLFLLALYALGYLVAAASRGAFMARLPLVNVIAAYAAVIVLLALVTPLADPARLATADQMARLMSGKTDPAKFDYAYLMRSPTRAAQNASNRLLAMEGEGRAGEIGAAARAAQALLPTSIDGDAVVTEAQIRTSVPIAGAPLPQEILDDLELCARGETCAAFRRDLDADPELEIVVARDTQIVVYDRAGDGERYVETARGCCFYTPTSLSLPVEAKQRRYQDLKIGNDVVRLNED